MHSVLIAPIITEKSTRDAGLGKFTFRVNKQSNKTTIKKAIEDTFSVAVVSVTTQILKGRRKRVGKLRVEISQQPWKKAVVELKAGQKIDLFETEEKK